MKREDFFRAIGEIDDAYIEEAAPGREKEYGKKKSKRRFLKIGGLAAGFAAVFFLGFISSSLGNPQETGMYSAQRSESAGAVNSAITADEDAFADGYAYVEKSVDTYDADFESADTYDAGVSGEEGTSGAVVPEQSEDGAIDETKLVYTCNLTIQTKEYASSQAKIREMIKSLGGVVESESETNSNYSWYLNDNDGSGYLNWYLTVRIPTKQYESFVNSAGTFGKVISRSSSVENITKRYYSTANRVQALEKELEKLQEMMEKADSVDDMITIEGRISEVEWELNDYRTSLSDMDRDVAYSTVYLSLEEVSAYKTQEKEELTFAQRIRQAFENSWYYFVSGLESFLFCAIYALPYLAAALCVVIVILILRRILRKMRKKKRERKQ